MKAQARSYVWWPEMDNAIENWVATCNPCQETRRAPPMAKPTKWETPMTLWAHIHIDYAGPCQGQMFLIVVDAYSKWLEVILMNNTTSEATIGALQRIFTTHGLPDTLVSDNGPQFTSQTFETFLAELGIRHALSAPAHPATNGQAEIMVKLAKKMLLKMGPGDWQERID
uniref:Gypsy retrotransposon integrase-like protein 1 n=1 Tax=Micrurus lemniscatus lemniscatus TaxID=129467 RepID=A0A2D4HB47_MICLE